MGRARFLDAPPLGILSWSIRLANLIRRPAVDHSISAPPARSRAWLGGLRGFEHLPLSIHQNPHYPKSWWRKLKVSGLRLTGRCSGPNSHDLLPSFVHLVYLVSPLHSAGCRAAKLFSLGVSPLVIVIRKLPLAVYWFQPSAWPLVNHLVAIASS